MNLFSVLKVVQGWVRVKGDSDGTFIGNVGDKMKVTGPGDSAEAPGSPAYSKKLRIEMTEPGLTIPTAFVEAFKFVGKGKFIGFIVDTNISHYFTKLTIDGSDVIFDLSSSLINTSQMPGTAGLSQTTPGGLDWSSVGSKLRFRPEFPIIYETEVKIEMKKDGGGDKTLTNLVVALTKEP